VSRLPEPTRAAVRRALWPGIAALVAVMGISRFVYTPILPDMLAAEVLTLRGAGWVASANFVGYLIGALAASRIPGRLAQSRGLRAGLAVSVLALLAMALLDGIVAWMAVRFVAGMASAFALVFVSTQVLERLSAIGQADRTIWLYSGVGIGIVVSALGVQAAVAAGLPWPGTWAAAAAIASVFAAYAWAPAGVVQAGAVQAGHPGVPAAAAPAETAAPADLPAPRAFRAAVLAYGLFGLGYVIHATYLPAMVRAAGYAPAAASWIWVLVGAVALPSIAYWRGIAQRSGARTAIVGCYLVQGVTALVPLFAGDSIAAAAIAALGLGATFIPASGLALPFARGLDPAGSARAIGVMTAAFGAGQIVGPVAAAYLAERSGFGGPSALACGVLLAAAVLMRPRFDAVR
jgi:predicted MFS family arabinose efflux permease